MILRRAALATFAIIALAGVPVLAQTVSQPSRTTLNLMPVPSSVTMTSGTPVRIDRYFRIATVRPADPRLERAIGRTIARLEHHVGVPLSHGIGKDTTGAVLIVDCDGPGEKVQSIDEDESYTIEPRDSALVLHAKTTVGAIRGLETVFQLVSGDAHGFFLPPVRIADTPRFRWRGLLVDVSRHWEPVENIERTLDGMAAVKLNVFHWHLSDDQGFRVESKRFPRLQHVASDSLYYTQAQIRRIVAYARDRGIRVVPEFDMPGHSTTWLVAYPQYAGMPGPYMITRNWGSGTGEFDPTRESTYRFIDQFIGEMTSLFPDAYWHIGGDEVVGKQWNTSPRIVAFKKAHGFENNAALQAYFNQRLSRIVAKHHRHMIGWDEVLHPQLPRTTIVQSWRGNKYLDQAVTQGFDGILSAPYYLDAMKSAETMYLADPLPSDTALTAEQATRVLGGEATMWAELVTSETIESRVWPRLAAIAERFWSPRDVRDVPDMYRRLWIQNARLEQLGLRQESHTNRMLRNIVNGPDIGALAELLRYSEPVTLGQRLRVYRSLQDYPLVQLVDAAIPDPPSRFGMQQLASAALSSQGSPNVARDSLRAIFTSWQSLPQRVESLSHSPIAQQGAPRAAAALASAGTIGLAALDAIERHTTLAPDWASQAQTTLRGIDTPQGMLHVTVVPAIQILISQTPRSDVASSH
jgi:hexosaminidase